MRMTVREAIDEMKKVCADTITTCNGTKIILHEIDANRDDYIDCIGSFKWDNDGNPIVLRRIFCTILPSKKTRGLDDLKKNTNWWLFNPKESYNYFRENDFCIPERIMNQFISLNEDVDTYHTIYQFHNMIADTMISNFI